jgi:hypothetical protein
MRLIASNYAFHSMPYDRAGAQPRIRLIPVFSYIPRINTPPLSQRLILYMHDKFTHEKSVKYGQNVAARTRIAYVSGNVLM